MRVSPQQAQGENGFKYDAGTDEYVFNWNVDKSWKNTCRVFVLGLTDGTTHNVAFHSEIQRPPSAARVGPPSTAVRDGPDDGSPSD